MIEVRGFKWPRRPTSIAVARLLGEDRHGRWLGVAAGSGWHSADGARSGVFKSAIVKLIPKGAYWTACFQQVDPVVDFDIVLPVRWMDDAVEEIDLELDVLRGKDGRVWERDRDVFEQVRARWGMPAEIVAQAEATCAHVRAMLERGDEPFGVIGHGWLARFLGESGDRLG